MELDISQALDQKLCLYTGFDSLGATPEGTRAESEWGISNISPSVN